MYRIHHPSTHQETRLEQFCALFNTELKALYDSGETGVEHQANHTAILNRMENLELVQEQANTNINQLYTNQETITSKVDQDGASVPGAIITSGESVFSANESLA